MVKGNDVFSGIRYNAIGLGNAIAFDVAIKGPNMSKGAVAQTRIDAQFVVEIEFVEGVKCGFVRIQMLCRSGIEDNGVVLCRKTRWREVVVGIEPTPLDAVFGVREIREIDFGGVVADTGSERHAKFVLGGRKFKVVVRIRKSGIQEKLTCEQMVPAQGSDAIAPRHINSETSVVVFKREDILAVISTQINAVFIGEFVVEFGIEVVEEIT